MKLLLPPDYVKQAAADVKKAKKRVLLMTMVLNDTSATHELIAELEAAAGRGVEVIISADVFTYGEVGGSFLPVRYYNVNSRLTTKMAKRLKAAGAKFQWLGRGRSLLFSGRTHMKWCVVDDTVYTFGGINMYESGIYNVDYMFKLKSEKLAERLVHEQKRIARAERTNSNYPSTVFPLDDHSVLFDGGIVGQSIIYRHVNDLARAATDVLFVSQYGPTGRLGRTLKKKNSRLYFNRPEQADLINWLLIKFNALVTGTRSLYTKDTYLHAKFMIFTLPNGSKVAVTGSHNFASSGVMLGTREIALETKDPAVISQLESFFDKHVA
jgi:cardiolipin synthase